ncbi:hypothetical protein [Sphingomonas immobilis]|uniref:Uncharacterized protein n=1 Tax=Sphingomonas immobilis TaxID=3063997 RepID=A0ABT9A064_9SPHN|nr:hypothetical protein [Sphingomonas sp. CA1-15]MDO7843226.1 hypothetical protein [Sphingomonas sp. CA1-15]
MPNKPYDEATKATAEQGEVMLDGPDGLAVSLTPEAASRSAHAIRTAADEATLQREARTKALAAGEHEGSGTD